MTGNMKWLVGGLAVSLALNFLILGIILGNGGLRPDRGPDRHERPRFSIERLAETLSPESREILHAAMKEQRSELKSVFRERRAARRAAGDVLRAETFDPKALRAAFERMREADIDMQRRIQDVMVDVAAQLPPEERAKLADWRRHMRKRMRDRDSDHRWDHQRSGPGEERPY